MSPFVPVFLFIFVALVAIAVVGAIESGRLSKDLGVHRDMIFRLESKIEYLRWDVEKLMKQVNPPREAIK